MSDSALRVRKSKRLNQTQNQGNADRISALPDSVLSHILSYLPTKNAVATSLVARRWKLLWTSVQKLCFDDREFRAPPGLIGEEFPAFSQFVETVLQRTNPTNIIIFSLRCYSPVNESSFHSWVCSALMRNAKAIELYLEWNSGIELPEQLYTSKTVEVLKLQSDFVIKVPPVGQCFTNVKILSVQLEGPENTLTENLFCRCPSLEELSIEAYLNDEGPTTNFVVSSCTLKRCTLWVATEGELYTQAEYKVIVNGPRLERLHITSDLLGLFEVDNVKSLKDVRLDIVYGERSRVDPIRAFRLLRGLNNTNFLSISNGILYALDLAYHNCFPSLYHLQHLDVTVGAIGWRVLPVILSSSVLLQTIVLRKKCWFDVTQEQFHWIEGDIVPRCLLQHVKKIEITGVQGDDDEEVLLKYLLKYSAVLEVMVICFKGSVSKAERREIGRSIMQLQRASNICQLQLV